MTEVLRYAAFTTDPAAGNPAGVVLDAGALTDPDMQAIAADVGYSETAFLTPTGPGEFDVRYFSPQAEVPFCGHATIASAVAVAERAGTGDLLFRTPAGAVPVATARDTDGRPTATLTSVAPSDAPVAPDDLAEALAALAWNAAELDPSLPPRVAYAGAHHLILAAATRERLAALDYDFDRLRDLMRRRDWTTVALVWRASGTRFDVRNPFPVGGVVEDPATGAAAAAFGGYLRTHGLVEPPATLHLHQGADLGRPGLLVVDVPATGGVRVTGNAVVMPG
ncbi:PhzF family phenazine biosynthesis isomerase [Micromonospora terminaliae]|uniref:PhzF family phenazine biosynthesis isomerase n=1 Tax=Micromonospora terminaliae TaxID=1914461 RepID=A0AAJ2ZDQ8_9ACTN|nr:PhzF family phenazine biosynthesis isomerase [Micromonospora terminaliae]NES27444.1 PhzF family phenazine biosynthesis protein [Micromonospora terminaliae]QGL47815.1 PhzF family phenazine biosynthesis isomerase [Micromonospora terminaliae]